MGYFETHIALRWGDMDPLNHLNNTLYFRLMEEARIQWFAQLGMSVKLQGEGPILAHIACDFLKPMTYPSDALVKQVVARIGRSSLDHEIAIERADAPGVIYAKGKAVIVWMDYALGRSAPWPAALLEKIQAKSA